VVLNQKAAIKLLRDNGWKQEAGGKHSVKMCKPKSRPITLPKHKGRDYSKGLAASILREAGL
jgi:predicted RNA binding protein YcfA (HicA-like mRNA interferase family)